MNRVQLMAALAIAAAPLGRPTKRHYSDDYGSRNRREKAISLPPVGSHATDTSVTAVAAAIAKRERKAYLLQRNIKRSISGNKAHQNGKIELIGKVISDTPAHLNPLYINRSNPE